MNPDVIENPWWQKRIADLESRLIQNIKQLDSAVAEGKGLRSANKSLQEVVLKLSETLGDRNDEIKSLEEIIGERDTEWEQLQKTHKSNDELLNVTLINLSNTKAALDKLRGTDEYTHRKMRQRIAELECLVLQAAVDKQVVRPDTKDECTRDIAIACSMHSAIQTGIRFGTPAIALVVISFLMMVMKVVVL